MSKEGSGIYISAGDLEKYGYCPLSWWYSRKEPGAEDEEQLGKGQEQHQEFGKKLEEIKLKEIYSNREMEPPMADESWTPENREGLLG